MTEENVHVAEDLIFGFNWRRLSWKLLKSFKL